MGLIQTMVNVATNLRALGRRQPTDRAAGWGAFSSQAGTQVSEDSAMRYATVHACVRVLAEDVAALPLHVYRRTNEGGKERAREHPLYELMHDQPNPDMTSSSLREAMMVSLLLSGNAYAFIEFARSGRVKALWPLDSGDTQPYRTKSGELRYRSGGEDLAAYEVLHIPGLSFDGLLGLSPIAYAREAVGLGLAAEQFGSKFFKDGTHLGGVISVAGGMSDEAFDRSKAQFNEQYAGMQRAHKVLVLEGGATYSPLGIPPEDAQFLETRKFQRSEIAAIFRVPPHLIGDLERATFSNIEHQDGAYLQRTLLPWLTRWEQAFRVKLLTREERRQIIVEHDTSGFMRGDTKSRMESYSLAINAGVMTRNEARQRENLNPLPGGDELLQPLNMTPASGIPMRSLPFPPGVERRTAEEDKAALSFTGVTGAQYDALRRALRNWLKVEASDVLDVISKQLQQRSAEAAITVLGALKSYYGDLQRHMPEDMKAAIDSISWAAYEQACEQLGDASPSRDWFARRLEWFYSDEMQRLKLVNQAELEGVLKSAIGDDKELWGLLNRRIRAWPEERAEAIAKTEAAFTRNKMLIRTYRKGGYQATWHAAPSCCELCRRLDGVVVATLSPPLHSGCVCTVTKGASLTKENDPWVESDSISVPLQILQHAAYGRFTAAGRLVGGGHLTVVRKTLVEQGVECPILHECPNGVRFGNISNHRERQKRYHGGQSWFPDGWTEDTVLKAGKHVYATGEEVDSFGHGRAFEGMYDGVNVRINVLEDGVVNNINPSYNQP